MEENKKTNWGVVIGIVIATVAVLGAGVFIAVKLLNKKKADSCKLEDDDICVLDDDDSDELDLGDKE